ncbi:MAG: methylenetetrahydrofolate reductase, partial [Pseudomonadota bacterium]|nr:methylenetetrahydrofolate reductase [Pseudomonadota bacterium]
AAGAAQRREPAGAGPASGPSFYSATPGAGATTQEGTLEAVQAIAAATGVPGACHLTCVGATREEVDAVARHYLDAGIRRIVALRGDPPGGPGHFTPHPGGYRNAADLVGGLMRIADFDISVAAYPERHPDSPDRAADLANLKAKLDAGAARAVTQFFFDAEDFLRFRDEARKAGIDKPLVPGIMPIRDLDQIRRFAAACGASVPDFVADRIEAAGPERADRQAVSVDLAAELCERLAGEGIGAFHIYTLNQSDMTAALCARLRAGEAATVDQPAGD